MKKYKIAFWITTTIIFLFESVASALTFQSPLAREGIAHLGYPLYFGALLMVFKVIGGLALMLPQVTKRHKEWAYVGFGIDFICAFVSYAVVDGVTSSLILPIIFMVILAISYTSYHKLNA
ncbi:MAG: DoxX family protein [Candidatus Paceibacterota bacterium]